VILSGKIFVGHWSLKTLGLVLKAVGFDEKFAKGFFVLGYVTNRAMRFAWLVSWLGMKGIRDFKFANRAECNVGCTTAGGDRGGAGAGRGSVASGGERGWCDGRFSGRRDKP
jgi:hypothetical protein